MRLRVPPELEERIKRAVDKHGYKSYEEFGREAIRRRLEELGIDGGNNER